MTPRRFSIWFARAAIVGFSAAMTLVGCGKQSEGERCVSKEAGNTDCEEGLVCVPCYALRTGQVDRCCPPVSAADSTGSCERADPPRNEDVCNSTETTGGRGGGGGLDGGGMSGGGGTSGGGASGIGGEGGA